MTDGLAAFLPMGKDASVKDLGELWGDRPIQRRTHGTPERTVSFAVLDILAEMPGLPERCKIPGMEQLAQTLADAWGGEDGWDTDRLIKGVGATRGQPLPRPEPEPHRFP